MKKFNIISILIIVIFFLGNVQPAQGIEKNEKEGKIHKNIYIEDIDVSNLTKQEAIIKINKMLEENNKLDLYYKEGTCKVNLKDLGVTYKVEEAVKNAFDMDKKDDFIKDLKTKISLDVGKKKVVKLECIYDKGKLEDCIESIYDKIYLSPVSATAKLEDGIIITSEEQYGEMVDKSNLNEMIVNRIEGIYGHVIKVPILNIEPKFKLKELEKIDTVLGTYETYFNPEIENRVNNIEIAANATRNTLIGKNEEFSFNSILMESNSLKNMKEAPVIINGKLDKGLGGGICQVSSTIYNAALYAGMDITNIKNHSIPSAYISKGRDATVSLGDVDFKFKNKFNTPILIYNEVHQN
ncbi:MAG: VanW family protein, partial [Peptostreptococcaceae bacterium]